MEHTTAPAPATKKYSPILCALAHLLIFASPYLYLRLYKRFFIAVAAMVVVVFLPVPYLQFFLFIGAMIDTYMQTQGINMGTVKQEAFDKRKHIGGCLLLIALVIASLVGRAMLRSSFLLVG